MALSDYIKQQLLQSAISEEPQNPFQAPADIPQVILDNINISKPASEMPNLQNAVNGQDNTTNNKTPGLANNIGNGLANFMQSAGYGLIGKPINAGSDKAGWQTYAGGRIGAALQDELLYGKEKGTNPSYYDTPEQEYKQKQAVEQAQSMFNMKYGDSAPEDIADAVASGDMAPDELKGMYGAKAKILGILAKKGVNLAKLRMDWAATTRQISSLNGPQQERLRQALQSTRGGLGRLLELNQQLDKFGFNPANAVLIDVAKTGFTLDKKQVGKLSQEQQNVLTEYLTQLTLLKDELAQVFQGGYAPTQNAFELTKEVLNSSYNKTMMEKAVKNIDYNLNLRENAVNRPYGYGVYSQSGVTQDSGNISDRDALIAEAKRRGLIQ